MVYKNIKCQKGLKGLCGHSVMYSLSRIKCQRDELI